MISVSYFIQRNALYFQLFIYTVFPIKLLCNPTVLITPGEDADAIMDAICNLPIDEFFADVTFAFGHSALKPIDWMNDREPNEAHKLIATLVKSLDITTVLTPNFDLLIEKTLPEFESVLLMKNRSRDSEDEVMGTLINPLKRDTSRYLDPSFKKIFHLHGASLKTSIELTPGATSVPFDHFDQANLSERLGGTTLLVVGSSGGWDHDVLDVLKRCDIEIVLWVCHSNCLTFSKGEVPEPWLEFFHGRTAAIKGNTTNILAELAQVESKEIDAGDLSEFEEYVVNYFKDYDIKRKLYTWAVLANKVFRGDVANSILNELEKELEVRTDYDKKLIGKEIKILEAPQDTDSLITIDGLRLSSEQLLNEYIGKKSFYCRMSAGFWQVIIGRARTIAISRDSRFKNNNNKREAYKFLRDHVMIELEKILPYEHIGPKEMIEYKWLTREWMLAYESAGIFCYEKGDAESAITYLQLALRICRNEEDRCRIHGTIIIAKSILELRDLLNVSEAEEVKGMLEDPNTEIDDLKVAQLIQIAYRVFLAGGLFQALKIYEGVTQRWPKNVLYCLNYSNILRSMRNFNGAINELDRCLKGRPNDYRLLCNKGYTLNELGRQSDAILVLKKALKLCFHDKHSWVNLGNSYYEKNRLREALDKYQQALVYDPEFEIALINKDNTLRRLAKRIW